MKFNYIIGNPPYQEDIEGGNKSFAPPIYDKFLDAAYELAEKVEMIHPARFLFNAGSTSKNWNENMLSDPNLKVLKYYAKSAEVFNNTDITGGIAITYHDKSKTFGAIKVFTAYEELGKILSKVERKNTMGSISDIIFNQNRFNLDALYKKYPEYKRIIGSNGKDKRFRNNIFEKVSLFSENKANNDDVPVIGVIKNKRVWRCLPKEFIDLDHENISKWKVLVPSSNGSGAIGEVIPTPLIGDPLIEKPFEGYTQTFIGIGAFNTEQEAQACMKYVKTKFARAMLGILKIIQNNAADTWKYVPLQDFTSSSDIDWSESVDDIDKRLYKKYGLDRDENNNKDETLINFIEEHIKGLD